MGIFGDPDEDAPNSLLNILEVFGLVVAFQTSVATYRMKNYSNRVLEFIFSVLPLYIGILYLRYILLVILFFLSLMIFLPKNSEGSSNQETVFKGDRVVANVRFIIIACVLIAIFIADLPLCDSEKVSKTMSFGLRLMDVGAGCFVYNAGMMSLRASVGKKITNALIALLLGCVRLWSIWQFKLSVNKAEFGTHLNFFFCLAILNILFIFTVFPYKFPAGLCLCFLHEVLLRYCRLEKAILNTTRSNWFSANIEGLAFIMPQLGIALMAGGFADMYHSSNRQGIVFCEALSVLLMVVSLCFTECSRRLHNLLYCLVITNLINFNATLFWLQEKYLDGTTSIQFPTQSFSSWHMLGLLLWGNVVVFIHKGIMNKDDYTSMLISHIAGISYVILVFAFPQQVLAVIKRRSKKECSIAHAV